ncbi:DNA polymerase Y family protein [Pseudorhodoferax sp.]|uniref:DNA polymerase Y family protein n=1 Tax=Pseudorhodoferax sp. TaxID=1993553 RepID=UPI002DD66946|nr:DNA polymerase Y family protein [Pseudorhodoferax sp.]
MTWIALSPPEDQLQAWCWQALRFTPRVAVDQGCVLLEVSSTLRLWGGPRALLVQLLQPGALQPCRAWARAGTAPVALALLHLKRQNRARPAQLPDGLPLDLLAAAAPALAVLERTGCCRFGQLRALPRAGVARRFGAALLEALDQAYGERPMVYDWCRLPPVFDQNLELPAIATTAPELLWTGQRLLDALQIWLRASQRGVLALELEWTHDLRRLDGRSLPRLDRLPIRTAQPTLDMAHLRRLLIEHLARQTLAAPANHLRLRTLETAPLPGASASLLPEEQHRGEPLHALVERLAARLGADRVLVPRLVADHRPEQMQRWVPAQQAGTMAAEELAPDAALYPAWLLREPLALQMDAQGQPQFHGPLQLLARPRRVEGAGWWDLDAPKTAVRDYRLARSAQFGLLWLYCERPYSGEADPRWFLQGAYA